MLLIGMHMAVHAVAFKNKEEVGFALQKAYSASFSGVANIFNRTLKDTTDYSRWSSLKFDAAYKTGRWYGTFMAFVLDDLKSYIMERSTIPIKGLDKNIMTSYNTIVKIAQGIIDSIAQVYNENLMASKRNVSRAQEAGMLICGLKNDMRLLQNEQKNPVLVKLAKEFGTASSKKDAIYILQQLAMIMEDTAKKAIKDVAQIAQQLNAELPACCLATGGQVCSTIDIDGARRPGIVPQLQNPRPDRLTPERKPLNIKPTVTEGMSMDDYNY